MPRPSGRKGHERIRAMRFALWAVHQQPHLLTDKQVGGLLDISRSAASRWMRDYRRATSNEFIDGIPGFLTPPHREITSPAATGTTATKGPQQ